MTVFRRKNSIYRICTSILMAVFLYCCFPAVSYASEPVPETSDMFADADPSPAADADVSTDSSQLPFDLSELDLDAYSDITIGIPLIPGNSSDRSEVLALQMLGLSSGFTAQNFTDLFQSAGFEVLDQVHFDKDLRDPAHTCAFTIGKGNVMKGLIPKKALLISIRGTNGGEWFSNFDFCSSHNENALFAENFLFAAQDAFQTLKPYIDAEAPSVILICGHSRGAACANLLGMLVDEYLGPEKVYVYTFATPGTIRKTLQQDPGTSEYSNIFNYLNPCDMVPQLPLPGWDFVRVGTDILLPVKEESLQDTIGRYTGIMYDLAPTITSYYNDRHSLTAAGTDDNGITSFELMLMVCDKLIDFSDSLLEGNMDEYNQLSDSDDLISEIISDESDLKPMAEMFREISENDFELGLEILMQHLPNVYAELISDFAADN